MYAKPKCATLQTSPSTVSHDECLAAGVKYDVKVTRTAPQAFRLHMGSNYVDIVGRKLNDGGLLIQVCTPPFPPSNALTTLQPFQLLCHGFVLIPSSSCKLFPTMHGSEILELKSTLDAGRWAITCSA